MPIHLSKFMKALVRSLIGSLGLELRRTTGVMVNFPIELTCEEQDLVSRIRKERLTMVSYERLFATALACKHVASQEIPGAFVECGVWRGGNSILAGSILRKSNPECEIILFDTFTGMTRPTNDDIQLQTQQAAMQKFSEAQTAEGSTWCLASIDDVRANFEAFGIHPQSVRLIQGDVCETLNVSANLPDQIAVLRLDTDWYHSTRKELEVLYPRLVSGGILMVDDYGHWAGAKKAVDEYFARVGTRPFFQYTDYSGRCALKP